MLFQRPRTAETLLLALLLGVLLVGSQVASVSAQYEVPAFNLGETIPVTLYIRLQRQTTGLLAYITGNGDIPDDAVEEDLEDAMITAHEQGAVGVLRVPTEADLIGNKHQKQVRRLIPPQQAPRFAMEKLVWLPSKQLYQQAERQLVSDAAEEESGIALRFSVGKRLNKETTWVPVVTRVKHLQRADVMAMLSPEFQQELAEVAGTAAEKGAATEVTTPALPGEGDTVYYLAKVTLFFGFQTGMLNRITSLRYEFVYSASLPDSLAVSYIWDEHRAYDSHTAITICCAISVVMSVGMLYSIVGFHTGKAARQFKKRAVIVRHRKE